MKTRTSPLCTAGLLLLAVSAAPAQTVRFDTNMGIIDVNLLPDSAPRTVENFLRYVDRGAYDNSFFHRSVPGFIIQGGGYRFEGTALREIPSDPPVRNEFRVSNGRGTIAMAKLGNDPNSATNQWFFNLANNAANLNSQNGGFTVFGRVANSASLTVMDRIAQVPWYNAGSPFDQIPLRAPAFNINNVVLVRSITILTPTPSIRDNGLISVSNFGGLPYAAPGSYVEIYGSDLAGTTREWAQSDFTDGRAPTTLESVSVTIDGKPAFVHFVSPTQINVQVPSDASSGSVPVVVTSNGRASAAATIEIRRVAGGLLAPASFKVGDKQYAAAIHNATGAFVSNGSIPNVDAAPAVPGETLVFYGIGFGPVTPGEVAGQVAGAGTSVMDPVEFRFGDIAAQVTYAGLVPNLVGVYQFNVVVPAGLTTGDVEVKVLSAGQPISQTLYLPVQLN